MYTGLLAALNRYDHPALNVVDPDIRLEEMVERGNMVGFSLSADAYECQARVLPKPLVRSHRRAREGWGPTAECTLTRVRSEEYISIR